MSRGEFTIPEAARREGGSLSTIAKWRDRFYDGDRDLDIAGSPAKPKSREQATLRHRGRSTQGASPVARRGLHTRLRRARGRPRRSRDERGQVVRDSRDSAAEVLAVAARRVLSEGSVADTGSGHGGGRREYVCWIVEHKER